MLNEAQVQKIRDGKGFIAALDQSGGSTPKALKLYGVEDNAWSNDDEMYGLIHDMRSRIVGASAFTGDRIIGAILFEKTMDREFSGAEAPRYLWDTKGVVPFLKCDKGLMSVADDCQLMKDMGDLDSLLKRARNKGVFGTKMRSVIGGANSKGIQANVAQQFDVAHQILGHDLVPIIEPEVTISISDKAKAEDILRDQLLERLDSIPEGKQVMLKLSLPTNANQYKQVIAHPKVLRVVALSGGYSRDEANTLLAQNTGMVASFSRGLTQGLSAQQSDADFNAALDTAIQSIYDASVAG